MLSWTELPILKRHTHHIRACRTRSAPIPSRTCSSGRSSRTPWRCTRCRGRRACALPPSPSACPGPPAAAGGGRRPRRPRPAGRTWRPLQSVERRRSRRKGREESAKIKLGTIDLVKLHASKSLSLHRKKNITTQSISLKFVSHFVAVTRAEIKWRVVRESLWLFIGGGGNSTSRVIRGAGGRTGGNNGWCCCHLSVFALVGR